jgi:hypothetical protein
MWAVLTFQNILEIYGRVKNCKSRSHKYFCWVFEIDFENFRIKMETLKEIAHFSDFSIFKILAIDLTLQIGIKIKLDNASS